MNNREAVAYLSADQPMHLAESQAAQDALDARATAFTHAVRAALFSQNASAATDRALFEQARAAFGGCRARVARSDLRATARRVGLCLRRSNSPRPKRRPGKESATAIERSAVDAALKWRAELPIDTRAARAASARLRQAASGLDASPIEETRDLLGFGDARLRRWTYEYCQTLAPARVVSGFGPAKAFGCGPMLLRRRA